MAKQIRLATISQEEVQLRKLNSGMTEEMSYRRLLVRLVLLLVVVLFLWVVLKFVDRKGPDLDPSSSGEVGEVRDQA